MEEIEIRKVLSDDIGDALKNEVPKAMLNIDWVETPKTPSEEAAVLRN